MLSSRGKIQEGKIGMPSRKTLILLILASFVLTGCASHYGYVRTPQIPLYDQTYAFHGAKYVPISRFCEYYGLNWDWDLAAERIEIKGHGKTLVFRPDSGLALISGNAVEFDFPVKYRNGTAYIPVKTALYVSEDVFGIKKEVTPLIGSHKINTVVIDPGHGGKDPGAISRYGTREKDIVLDISKRLKNCLQKRGIKVFLTRDRDVFIPLRKRAAFANDKDADLFISVHANAARHSRARGFEVFYLSEATDDNARALATAENAVLKFEENTNEGHDPSVSNQTLWDMTLTENRRQSRELADYICNKTSDELCMKKRGVKGARFAVLKGTRMPAVLVEVGFLTNRREENKLKRRSFREDIASAIADSIISYKNEYERTNGFTN